MKPWIAPFLLAAAALAQAPIMDSIVPRYESVRLNLIESAELMPAKDYGYRLTPEQRSFGEWIEHNIGMNFNSCAPLSAVPPTAAARYKGATDKTVLVEGLKASFDYCEPVFRRMTDAKILQNVQAGGKTVSPVNVLFGLVVNWNQHYGNMVGYLRTRGITPPSTARTQKKGKK
jgi:hypothetical protein